MALNILSIPEIAKYLKGKQLYIIAKETGISYPTLAKFFNKKQHNFTLDTLLKMTDYISNEQKPVVTATIDDL